MYNVILHDFLGYQQFYKMFLFPLHDYHYAQVFPCVVVSKDGRMCLGMFHGEGSLLNPIKEMQNLNLAVNPIFF